MIRDYLSDALRHLGVVAVSKLVPIATLLIYSQYLTPTEFGMISLFFSYLWLFGIALTLNLHTAIGRYIYDENYKGGELVGTTVISLTLLFILGSSCLLMYQDSFSSWLNLPASTLVYLVFSVLGQISESLLIQIKTARKESGTLLNALALRSISCVVVTVTLFYVLAKEKYLAVLVSEAMMSVLITLYLITLLTRDRPWAFSINTLRLFVSYSVPLIPYMLSLTLLAQFDRIMIDRIYGKEATGLYSMGFNLGMLVVLGASGLLNALNPRFFSAMNTMDVSKVKSDAKLILSFCAYCTVLLALLGPIVASFLMPVSYSDGFKLIPLIAAAGLASVVFQIWGRVIAYHKRTYQLSLIAVGATVLKIALNMVLLPIFGLWGGAMTTLVAYCFMAGVTLAILNRNAESLEIGWGGPAIWMGGVLAIVAVDLYPTPFNTIEIAVNGSVFCLASIYLWKNLRAFKRLRLIE